MDRTYLAINLVNGPGLKLVTGGVESALSHHALGISMGFLGHSAGSIILGTAETWRVAVALEAEGGVSAGQGNMGLAEGVYHAHLDLLDATSITCYLHSASLGDLCQRLDAGIIARGRMWHWRKNCCTGLCFWHDEKHACHNFWRRVLYYPRRSMLVRSRCGGGRIPELGHFADFPLR